MQTKLTRRLHPGDKQQLAVSDYTGAELLEFVQTWNECKSELEVQVQTKLKLSHVRTIANALRDEGIELRELPTKPSDNWEMPKIEWTWFIECWQQGPTQKDVYKMTGLHYGIQDAIVAYIRSLGFNINSLDKGYTIPHNPLPKSLGAHPAKTIPSLDWIKHPSTSKDYTRKMAGGKYEDCHGRYKIQASAADLIAIKYKLGPSGTTKKVTLKAIKKDVKGGE